MAKAAILAFVFLGTSAFVGVDYMTQAKAAGQEPGSYPITAYQATVEKRVAKLGEKDEGRVPVSMALPPAPQDWVRRNWHASDKETIKGDGPKPVTSQGTLALQEPEGRMGVLGKFLKPQPNKSTRKAHYVYEDARNILAIEVEFKRQKPETLQKKMEDYVVHEMTRGTIREGFARVQGVIFYENVSDGFGSRLRNTASNGFEERNIYRKFYAQMGEEISITVHAKAADYAVRGLLQRVDFAGLNALLTQPLPYVNPGNTSASPMVAQIKAQREVNRMAEGASEKSKEMMDDIESHLTRLTTDPTALAEEAAMVSGVDVDPSLLEKLKIWLMGEPKEVAEAPPPMPTRLIMNSERDSKPKGGGMFGH